MPVGTSSFGRLAVIWLLLASPSIAFTHLTRPPPIWSSVGTTKRPLGASLLRVPSSSSSRSSNTRIQLSLDDNWEDIANRIASQERSLLEQWTLLTHKTSQSLQWHPTFSKEWFAVLQTAVTDLYNLYLALPLYTEVAIVGVPIVAIMLSTIYRLSVPDPSYRSGMIPYRQQYDPIAAQAYYARHFTVVLQRGLEMFRLSNRFLLHIALDKYVWKREEAMRPRRAQELLQLIQTLGPTAIKVGQAMSVRPDLIPSEYATALSSLQDAVPPFDTTVARQMMRQELGVDKFDLLVLDAKSSKRPVARCVGRLVVVVVIEKDDCLRVSTSSLCFLHLITL